SGSRGSRRPQDRVLLLPRLPNAIGQVQVGPEGDQRIAVQVSSEILKVSRFAQHDLIEPAAHILVTEVERVIGTAPEQPDRELDGAVGGSAEVREAGSDDRAPTRTGLV